MSITRASRSCISVLLTVFNAVQAVTERDISRTLGHYFKVVMNSYDA